MNKRVENIIKAVVLILIAFGIVLNVMAYLRHGKRDDLLQPAFYTAQTTAKYPVPGYDSFARFRYLDNTLFRSAVYLDAPAQDTSLSVTASGFAHGLVLNYRDTLKTPARFSFSVINNFGVGKMGAATIAIRNFRQLQTRIYSRLSKYNDGTYHHPLAANISFGNVQLLGKTDFSSCKFLGDATLEFERTELPDTLDFSNTEFANLVDLTGTVANPSGPCYINLLHADIDKIKMQYGNFRLYFPNNMKTNPERYDEITSTYDRLLASMSANGFKDSYEELDCEYKLWKASRVPPKSSYFTDYANKLVYAVNLVGGYIAYAWWKFGYARERVVLWTLLFLIIFAAFNEAYYDKVQSAYTIENLDTRKLPQVEADKKRGIYAWLYTMHVFFRISLDFGRINFDKRITYVLILQYMTGLVCTGFLLNLIIR